MGSEYNLTLRIPALRNLAHYALDHYRMYAALNLVYYKHAAFAENRIQQRHILYKSPCAIRLLADVQSNLFPVGIHMNGHQ